jgi:glycosyltransferase involved in cell wall biosynthesis
MLVSVIIATKQEEKHIWKCISFVKKQSFPQDEIEIIVIDNYSSDKTVQIAKHFTKKVFTKGPERSAQRNFGVSKAHGTYILYLDADMYLSRRVIQECVAKMQKNPKLVGLFIRESIKGDGYFGAVRRFERAFYNGTVIDGLRFFKKSAFIKVGGFDEKLYACEDWDLDKRIKKLGPVDFIQEPIYHNDGQVTLKSYLMKKIYYSHNFSEYIHKWGKVAHEIGKPTGVFQQGEETSTGSFRSIPGFSVIEALEACADLFEKFGGHEQAAGLTIRNDRFDAFLERFGAIVRERLQGVETVPELLIDAELHPGDLSLGLVQEIRDLSPFGEGNPEPVFQLSGLEIEQARTVGKDSKHWKLTLSHPALTQTFDAVGWSMVSAFPDLGPGNQLSIVCQIEENTWNGRSTLQLKLLDVKPGVS